MAEGFTHVGDRLVHRGHFVQVVEASYTAPDGSTFIRDVVRSRGAVAIVPVRFVDGVPHVVLLRQYRPPYDADLIEIPAGVRDVDGEDLAETAQRELGEEAGLHAGTIVPIGKLYPSPGLTDAITWLFLATDLIEVPHDAQGPEEEAMEIFSMPLSEAVAAVERGEILDAKTVIGLLRTERRLAAGAP
jgi:8-oxo-dGTP pyrophosphatase MutT (NUDIX family)